jgi:hypothetical protein
MRSGALGQLWSNEVCDDNLAKKVVDTFSESGEKEEESFFMAT